MGGASFERHPGKVLMDKLFLRHVSQACSDVCCYVGWQNSVGLLMMVGDLSINVDSSSNGSDDPYKRLVLQILRVRYPGLVNPRRFPEGNL